MNKIVFNLHLFKGERDRKRSEAVLYALLRALTLANESWLRAHPRAPFLYKSGVRYQRESVGPEHWKDIPTVLTDGYGDCEDLASFRTAELRVRMGLPANIVLRYRSKIVSGQIFSLYHVLVRHPNGRIEDPSKKLGMKGRA